MSMDPLLKARLEPVARRRQHLRLSWQLAAAWTAACLFAYGVLLVEKAAGWVSVLALPVAVAVTVVLTTVLLLRGRRRQVDWREIALAVEAAHPELQGRLITAVQQDATVTTDRDYLRRRIIGEAVEHSRNHQWAEILPRSRFLVANAAQLGALALCVLVIWQLRAPVGRGLFVPAEERLVSISPGDVELERGSRLVVSAHFKGQVPARVELVYQQPDSTHFRAALSRSLADPLFGGTVPEVTQDLTYHVEYGGKRTRDYRVTVFDYPRLERADADVQYPSYTGLSPKRIENTRRFSAVEGSRIQLRLQLNKAVAMASLISRDTNRTEVKLAVEAERPLATLRDFLPARSRTYELQLIDVDGRTNKVPAQFVFDVLKNRSPELKVAAPRGDTRPSPLEEVAFEGTVFDDFGVQAFGLATAVAGREPSIIELGRSVPAKEKRSFNHVVRLEDLSLQAGDLVSWFAWVDDIGPDGRLRRTTGDLYFAEVRPFEEIFREGESMSANAQQQQQQQSGQGGSQAEELAELQKQIINATWKLFRQAGQGVEATAPKTKKEIDDKPVVSPRSSGLLQEKPVLGQAPASSLQRGLFAQVAQTVSPGAQRAGRPNARPSRPANEKELSGDLDVVSSAQEQALQQAADAGQGGDPRTAALWEAVAQQMERALDKLRTATNSPAQLQEALAAEQAAYQALLKLREREYSVSRSQNRQASRQSGRQQQMQRQLDQLDLQREENRYESERQAQPPQDPGRSEQLQVMNRLQELARRQQDVNERLKELQTALQEVRTDAAREEIRRELKRLQEEQQELLADADEVRQRMDRPENQSSMSEQRQQMEQARQEIQQAAEAARQGRTSQALASGTRAQRQLQEMREEMRRQNAGEFSEELRQMRTDVRELARRQEEVQEKMDALTDPQRRTLTDADSQQEILDRLASQRERLTNLVNQATQLSRDTEEPEPLVSSELYDTLRRFSQNDTSTSKQFQEEFLNRPTTPRSLYERLRQTTEQSDAKALDLTSEMLRLGLVDDAVLAQERARAGIEDLKRGVERAAEVVLGDDTQALRLAGEELDRLARQLQDEIARSESAGTNSPPNPPSGGSTNDVGGQQLALRTPGETDSRQGASENLSQPGTGAEATQSGSAQFQGGDSQSQSNATADRQSGGQRQEQQGNQSEQANRPGDVANQGQVGDSSSRNLSRDGQEPRNGGRPGPRPPELRQNAQRGNGPNRPTFDLDRLLEGRGGSGTGPITGEDFASWSDGLREIEELVDNPSLRTEVARARERARQMRQDFTRAQKKPDWANVRLQILTPLVEVREEIQHELARRDPQDRLVPIDRDPVPARYSELVRRYYERLGKDNPEPGLPAPNPEP